jgi:hypothetical protein
MSFREDEPRIPQSPLGDAGTELAERPAGAGVEEYEPPSSDRLMAIAKQAVKTAETGEQSRIKQDIARSYRAYASQHAEGSKYKSPGFKARSKLFVPKTRSAVRKNVTAFATAMFSTDDVVSIQAENDGDQRQLASAAALTELLSIRLDRANKKAGVDWFRISCGACQTAQIAGYCVSKQYWQYEFRDVEVPVEEEFGEGAQVIDNETGEEVTHVLKEKVLRDRAVIEDHAPENVIFDMAAPWHDPVQGGAFFIVKIPMHVGDVRSMMRKGRQYMGGGGWFEIPEKVLAESARDYSATNVRTARGHGNDRFQRSNSPSVTDLDIVWVHENFVRVDGEDYHFWSLGTRRLMSEPRPTEESYPAFHGDRPYVMGVAAIEAHNVLPMSPVQSWKPLQDESNDIRNLTLDTVKQTIAPHVLVKRGAQVDLRSVRERGPDATTLVGDVETDIKFIQPGSPNGNAFVQADRLNVEFDELSGNFSTSAVQSNRNLNETVGGMQIMSGTANGQTEFDLRVFTETWSEPVLRQVVQLIQYYETDEKILTVAGRKAELMQRYGIDAITDDMLEAQVTTRVNVGIGAVDPMMRLQKFVTGIKTVIEMTAASPTMGAQLEPNAEELVGEAMGLSGYKDANRFFRFKTLDEAKAEAAQNPPPEAQKVQLEAKKAELDHQIKVEENAIRREELQLERGKVMAELRNMAVQNSQQQQQFQHQRQTGEQEMGLRKQEFERTGQHADREFGMKQQEFQRGGVQADREFGLKEGAQQFAQGPTHQLALAGHNKALVDERNAQMADPSAPAGQSPLEQVMAGIGMAITQLAQTTQQLVQSQQQQNEMIAGMMAKANAPKRVVRDGAGQVVGVETVGG